MDNKSQILECALDLFSLHGYDAVGVQQIVSSSGVTKPTLYHYFGNKRGLLDEILKSNYSSLQASILQASDYKGDLPLTLHKTVTAYITFANTNPRFYRMFMSMMYSPPESEAFKAVSPFIGNQLEMLEKLFLSAVNDHGNMRGRHKTYALSLVGMISTYIQMHFSGGIELNDEIVFKAVHQYMHGIYS